MTATTIKVSRAIRDRLKEQAAAHERTIGEHIEALLDEESRRDRFAMLRAQMAESPVDAEYLQEQAEWLSDSWS